MLTLMLVGLLIGGPITIFGGLCLYFAARRPVLPEALLVVFFYLVLLCWGGAIFIGVDHGLARFFG